jgi:molecular chaperone DnaK (HSP70)
MLIAIDFGTSNSSAALMVNGNVTLVKEPLKQGYSYPSSVYVSEAGEILVGQAAENNRSRDITRYRREFKRTLGNDEPYLIGDRTLSSEDLVTAVLRKLKQDGDRTIESYNCGKITDAVITIPATYREYKRKLMVSAGIAAGFSSVQLLPEPVAAAIYYTDRHQDILTGGEIILVYDLGGGTFDATLIQKEGSSFQILSEPMGLEQCGGTDFDRGIYQYVHECSSDSLRKKLSHKEEWRARSIVGDLCVQAKHQLSETGETTIDIPLGIDRVESYQLTRQELETRIAPLIDDTIEVCDRAIVSAGITWNDVAQVLMVGGSCRIPYVRKAIKSRLGHSPLLVDEPELAVCQGGAIYARLQSQKSSVTIPTPESKSISQPEIAVTISAKGSFRKLHFPQDPFEVFDSISHSDRQSSITRNENWF